MTLSADLKKVAPAWSSLLAAELTKPYLNDLDAYIARERREHPVFPPEDQVFTAFAVLPPEKLKVVLLGQDPYHGPGQAHGLSFSVAPGVAPPPSLVNMFKELAADLGVPAPPSGSLLPWAERGVLLLNAVMTVRQSEPASHKDQGWETFTDAVIRTLSEKSHPLVFVLWGGYARKKAKLIDKKRHRVFEGTHPSPLSAHQGFFGSKPYSKINQLLSEIGQQPIDWDLSR